MYGETDAARGFILIVFEPTQVDTQEAIPYSTPEPVARQLEEELVRTKSQLRSAIEQNVEELRASNEELQAMNEELRSSAEELKTSKEELQFINEELTTVNQELKIKIEELSHSNNNFQDLINSTDIGTIFLDRLLHVNVFSPAIRGIFNLIPNDIGRSLSDITHQLNYDGLLTDAETVLEKLQTVEREVSTTDGRAFTMRLLPYRTTEDRINGVLITFFDVTKRKQAEEALQKSEAEECLRAEEALRKKMDELIRFNRAMVQREERMEERMIELKKEVNELPRQQGTAAPYPLEFEKEDQQDNA